MSVGQATMTTPSASAGPIVIPMNPAAIVIADALEAVFVETNNYHRAARALRNRLIVMTLVAIIAAGLLFLMQWRLPTVHLVTVPSEAVVLEGWQTLLLVMVLGAIGALLTTIGPVSTLPPSNTPFNFPLQQAFLKIAVGLLTAPIGILAVAGVAGNGTIANVPALLLAAVAFGSAQQTVTRMLDQRATTLVESNPSTPSP